MPDQEPPDPFLTPTPILAEPLGGLFEEESEKRQFRERLETIDAQDVVQLAEDLKKFSGLFNQRLQAIAADDRVDAADAQLPFTEPFNPFIGENTTKSKDTVATFIRPTNVAITPRRPARRYRPPPMHVAFTLPGPAVGRPPAPYDFYPGPPMPHNPPMGPPAFPSVAGGHPMAYPPRQAVHNPGDQAPQPGMRPQGMAQLQNGHPIAKSFLGPPGGGATYGAGAQYNHPQPNQGGPTAVLPYRPGAGQQQMAPRRPLIVRSHAASRPPLPVVERPLVVRSHATSRPPLPVVQKPLIVQSHATSRPPLPVAQKPHAGLQSTAPTPQPHHGDSQPTIAPDAPYAPPPPFQPGAAYHPTTSGAAAFPARVPGPAQAAAPFPAPFPAPRPLPVPPHPAPHPRFAVPHHAPPNHGPSYAPPPTYPPDFAAAPGYAPAPVPVYAPVYAPVILGPLPGRPGALVWFADVPGQKGPAWVALPRQGNGRRAFVPKPTRGGAGGLRDRGSPVERVRRVRRVEGGVSAGGEMGVEGSDT